MWTSLNVPYFKETFHITHYNIEKLPEVKQAFKDASNVRFNTLRNSFLKWSKRNKRNMIAKNLKKRKHSTSNMYEVKDKLKKQKQINAEAYSSKTRMSETSSSNSEDSNN